MSYILDALRRADSERERGSVPGLNAQLVPLVPVDDAPPKAQPWPWIGAGAVIALAVPLTWLAFDRQHAADIPPVAPVAAVTASPPAVTAALPTAERAISPSAPPAPAVSADQRPRDATATPAQVTAPEPAPAPAAAPAPAVRSERAIATPRAAAGSPEPGAASAPKTPPASSLLGSTESRAAPRPPAEAAVIQPPVAAASPPARDDQPVSPPVSPAPAASSAAAASAPAAASLAAAPAASADSRIYALHELPDDIRRQLPQLVVGGSMYSSTPANRMLILNGQVLREADRPAPDLALEQIRLKSAVLRFKGYRFEITY